MHHIKKAWGLKINIDKHIRVYYSDDEQKAYFCDFYVAEMATEDFSTLAMMLQKSTH